jgi:hypothetical protein
LGHRASRALLELPASQELLGLKDHRVPPESRELQAQLDQLDRKGSRVLRESQELPGQRALKALRDLRG